MVHTEPDNFYLLLTFIKTCIMKKILLMLASAFFMFSCSQEEGTSPINENTSNLPVSATADTQLKFAKLLSQAASGSIEVRNFLKKEALVQFDNDYDIFYPLIKDKKVSGNQSFRDILLSYCKEENELSQIEQSLPLLNIMVPDLTLFWDFNTTTWDTSDKEISVLCRDDKNNTLYENGENIGNMTNGDIPGFPCLVVKNNERMKITSVNTRSGEATYEFISDAFDGSKKVQTRHYDADNDLEATEDLNKYVSKDVVATAINAWREFKNVPNACQRDYIYYGINKTNTPGSLNRNIREKLYRFRISATAFGRIADADGDQRLQDLTQTKRYLSNEEILQNIWTDGNFEFRFKSYIAGETNKDAMEHLLTFSVKAKDVFSIEKIHLHHKNGTAFRQSKNFYSVDINNLRSKWIYPEKLEPNKDNQVFTLPWDLYNKALSIHMYVEEFDVDQTIEKTITVVNEFTNKADFSIEGGGSIDSVKLSAKLGYGFSHTNTTTSSTKVTTTVGSDELGTLSFFFYDPIIRAESNNTYKLYDVSSGDVTATILPINLIITR